MGLNSETIAKRKKHWAEFFERIEVESTEDNVELDFSGICFTSDTEIKKSNKKKSKNPECVLPGRPDKRKLNRNLQREFSSAETEHDEEEEEQFISETETTNSEYEKTFNTNETCRSNYEKFNGMTEEQEVILLSKGLRKFTYILEKVQCSALKHIYFKYYESKILKTDHTAYLKDLLNGEIRKLRETFDKELIHLYLLKLKNPKRIEKIKNVIEEVHNSPLESLFVARKLNKHAYFEITQNIAIEWERLLNFLSVGQLVQYYLAVTRRNKGDVYKRIILNTTVDSEGN